MIDTLVDRGLLPDAALRAGIRRIVATRLRGQPADGAGRAARLDALAAALQSAPVATATDAANAQHYTVPTAFFRQILGPRLKYSCACWDEGVVSLADAEERMLALTCERARMADGQAVLDLGCGWGAFTFYAAERFPASQILAVSNSPSQREFITTRARERGLNNVTVVTADINTFAPPGRFDRVVSVEMLEHVRNHAQVLHRVSQWLHSDGRLFVHVFSHRHMAYLFESSGPSDWMARHFFTGGMMPSDDWLPRFDQHLAVEAQWRLGGEHYQRTAEAWLANFDARRIAIDEIFARTYGAGNVARWRARWRVFLMACAEMFGYAGGTEWGVSHYRFTRRPSC